MIDLLSDLLESLDKMIEAWEEFKAPGGQIGYFQDDADPNSAKSLEFSRDLVHIEEIVTELRRYRTDLAQAKVSCEDNEHAVSDVPISPRGQF
jgi:hypothetical protein